MLFLHTSDSGRTTTTQLIVAKSLGEAESLTRGVHVPPMKGFQYKVGKLHLI